MNIRMKNVNANNEIQNVETGSKFLSLFPYCAFNSLHNMLTLQNCQNQDVAWTKTKWHIKMHSDGTMPVRDKMSKSRDIPAGNEFLWRQHTRQKYECFIPWHAEGYAICKNFAWSKSLFIILKCYISSWQICFKPSQEIRLLNSLLKSVYWKRNWQKCPVPVEIFIFLKFILFL